MGSDMLGSPYIYRGNLYEGFDVPEGRFDNHLFSVWGNGVLGGQLESLRVLFCMVGYQQPKAIKTPRLFYCLFITNHGGLVGVNGPLFSIGCIFLDMEWMQIDICKAGYPGFDRSPFEFIIGGLILAGMLYREQLLIHGIHKSPKISDSLASGLMLIIEQLRIETENVTAFFVARHFTAIGGVVELCEMG